MTSVVWRRALQRIWAQCMELTSWRRQSCSPLPVPVVRLPGDPSGPDSAYHSAVLEGGAGHGLRAPFLTDRGLVGASGSLGAEAGGPGWAPCRTGRQRCALPWGEARLSLGGSGRTGSLRQTPMQPLSPPSGEGASFHKLFQDCSSRLLSIRVAVICWAPTPRLASCPARG